MNEFEIKTVQSDAIKIFFNAMSKICKEGTLKIDKSGIKILRKEDGVLIWCKLLSENFESFTVSGVSYINVDFVMLQKITKLIQSNDVLVFKKKEGDDFWSIQMLDHEKNKNNSFQIKLIEREQDELYIPPAEFEMELCMPSCEFKNILNQMKVISPDKIEIKSTPESKLIIKGEGESVNSEYILGERHGGLLYNLSNYSEVSGSFPYEKLLYCIGFTNLCNLIYIYIKNDYPLVIKYDIANLGSLKLVFASSLDDESS